MKRLNSDFVKAILLIVALMVFGGCEKEVEIENKDVVPFSDFLNSVSDFSETESISAELILGIENYQKKRIYIPIPDELNTKDVDVEDWKNVDNLITSRFDEYFNDAPEITYEERLVTESVQIFSLKFMKMYMLNVKIDEESTELVKKYLKLLIRHKSVDLDILTDAIVKYRDGLDENIFEEVKLYVLRKADENDRYVSDNIEGIQKRFNSTEPNSFERIETIGLIKNLQARKGQSKYVKQRLD